LPTSGGGPADHVPPDLLYVVLDRPGRRDDLPQPVDRDRVAAIHHLVQKLGGGRQHVVHRQGDLPVHRVDRLGGGTRLLGGQQVEGV
jgi:hypothetical protein